LGEKEKKTIFQKPKQEGMLPCTTPIVFNGVSSRKKSHFMGLFLFLILLVLDIRRLNVDLGILQKEIGYY